MDINRMMLREHAPELYQLLERREKALKALDLFSRGKLDNVDDVDNADADWLEELSKDSAEVQHDD